MQRYLQPSDVGKTFKTVRGYRVTIKKATTNMMQAVIFEGLYDERAGLVTLNMLGNLFEFRDGKAGAYDAVIFDG